MTSRNRLSTYIAITALLMAPASMALAQPKSGPPFDERLWQMKAGTGTILFRCISSSCRAPAMVSVQFSEGDRKSICEIESKAMSGNTDREVGGVRLAGTQMSFAKINGTACGYTKTLQLRENGGGDGMKFAVLQVKYVEEKPGEGARVSVVSTSDDLAFAQENAKILSRWLQAK